MSYPSLLCQYIYMIPYSRQPRRPFMHTNKRDGRPRKEAVRSIRNSGRMQGLSNTQQEDFTQASDMKSSTTLVTSSHEAKKVGPASSCQVANIRKQSLRITRAKVLHSIHSRFSCIAITRDS
ncbi:hypothetical protein, unlikely [Trypanosoma brucei gambiense DAL972]|uniref:Uncharacterized protein n=1 Tax=Trypanosoma brucei gambiense (strain MHOM/CI/86/DAL972) TaxID=679716 RepID=D0A935_TRYB9|nr:hypothetical protein, unlikely [Trypanosoma brucei gambiense DAL972]CBH18186.1 hypothetical protein, unlikely [Trypanosoma brucei gambiense DAL972]|eukprot:XP_011780450.1 hypothetical protein, unlikely [Trypanosoma brucei gambiense DAL972]